VVTTGPEKSPGDPEGNPDDDLNGSMKDELSERGVPAERDPKEDPDPEAAEGGYVIRGAGGDDESGDPLGDAVAAAGEGHEGGDDDGGGDRRQDKAKHEAHCPGEAESCTTMPVSLADRLQHPQDEGVQVVPEVRNCNVSMAHLYAHLGWVKHLK